MPILAQCPHCGKKMQVKDEFGGRKGKCPGCQQTFQVPLRNLLDAPRTAATAPAYSAADHPLDEPVPRESAGHSRLRAAQKRDPQQVREQIAAGFHGNAPIPRVDFGRKIGTFLVLVVLLLMPIFYIAVIGALVGAMVWLARLPTGGVLSSPVVWLCEAAGGIVLLCLLKPLLEPRRKSIDSHPLDIAKQPVLAELLTRIAAQIDSPAPAQLDLECSTRFRAALSAAAPFLPGRHIKLTLGLPLLACLSAGQLAGVIAGQMALVRRHAACRMTNIIRSINGWLWQSVYGSSRFDQWLRRMAQRPRFHAAKLLVPLLLARLPVQIVLFVPMFLANTLASGIARRAELDADLIAAQLVGRNSFAHLVQRLGMIDFAWQGILVELDFLYRDQQLPDSLPQQLAVRMLDMTPELWSGAGGHRRSAERNVV